MLWQRGLECKGCAEKADFVKLLTDNLESPIIRDGEPQQVEQKKSTPEPEKPSGNIDDIMESLKKSGLGDAKLFTAKDFEGLSPEQMSAKFSGKSAKKPKTPKKAPKIKTPKDDDEKIEL